MQIADYQATETAMDKVRALLDARQPAEAIAFADACEGDQPLVTQVRALACTHGGTMLRDRELTERGAWLWMQAGADKHPGLGYNLSNAHLDLWDLAVAEHGFVVAIQDHRHHLHTARELLFAAAADEQVPQDTRVQALTNLGNSYDNLGRDADAIAAYDQALAQRRPSEGCGRTQGPAW